MFALVANIFALGLFAQVMFWIVAVVLFPVFWIWMLVDAALRPEHLFPYAGMEEKLLWIIGMVFFHLLAAPYFVLVFRRRENPAFAGSTPVSPAPAPAPAPPTAAA